MIFCVWTFHVSITSGFCVSTFQSRNQRLTRPSTLLNSERYQKDGEESLVHLFQRALVMQRSGDGEGALIEYERFIKAAKQCDVPPKQYAEVFVNMGAIELKLGHMEMAEHRFKQALKKRPLGNAHVNLAALSLQQLEKTTERSKALELIARAQSHCEKAVGLNDEDNSATMASKLLVDIHKMQSAMQQD